MLSPWPNLWPKGSDLIGRYHKARYIFNFYEWEIAIGELSFD